MMCPRHLHGKVESWKVGKLPAFTFVASNMLTHLAYRIGCKSNTNFRYLAN